jgi:hypothetical protein
MAKKIINVNKPNDFINTGSAPNARDGDSLRSSFARLNDAIDNIDANFTEVYALATGGTLNGTLEIDIQGSVVGNDSGVIVNASNSNVNAAKVTAGAIEITGSTISTTDSSTIIIDQAVTVSSNLTVGGDVLPSVANGGDLGSSARPWRSLYVSNNTIYIGGTAVGIDANGALTTGGTVVGSTPAWANITGKPTIPTGFDRLTSSGDEVILIGGANPFVTFPAITGGDQLQIQGSEVSTVSGSLALTSQDNLNIISNGSGLAPGGSKNWTFGTEGSLTIPGDIRSEGNINIEINLDDSTKRIWQFGEDGELSLPEGAVVKTISGNLTIEGQNYVFIDSASNGQINIGTSSGVGAVVLGSKSRGTNVVVDDLQVANGVYEFFSSLADATGVVTHNCANGHLFYHTSPDANWTVNLTNLIDTWNRATSVTLIISQGATGYYPSAVQIAGVAQTIKWQGNATPTPSTNRTDVVTFSIINNSGTYIVLGQLTGF